MKQFIVSMIIGCALAWPGAVWSGETATEAIKRSIDTLIQVLSDEALKKPDRVAERHRQMEKIISERFSYEDMQSGRWGRSGPSWTNSNGQNLWICSGSC